MLAGLIAAQLAWPMTIDILGLGLRRVVWFTVGYALMVAVATVAQKARGNRGAVNVPARTRLDRLAAAVLAAVGLLVSGSTVVFIAAEAGILGGAEGQHMAADYRWFMLAAGIPMALGGLLALPPAWLLCRGRRGAGTFALLWVVPAALVAAALVATSGPGGLWYPFSMIVPSIAAGAPTVVGMLVAGWVVGREPLPRP